MIAMATILIGIGFFLLIMFSLPFIPPVITKLHDRWIHQRYRHQVREQFPDALYLLSGGLRAGLTLDEAFCMFVDECPNPLRKVFKARLGAAEAWLPLPQQIERAFYDGEWALLKEALILSSQFGAGLVQVVEEGVRLLKAKRAMRKKFEVMTAQSRATAWIVGFTPFGFMLLLWLFSPEFLAPFVSTSGGKMLLGIICFMDAVGLFVVKRMLRGQS